MKQSTDLQAPLLHVHAHYVLVFTHALSPQVVLKPRTAQNIEPAGASTNTPETVAPA